ncbi:galactosyl transferase GMA12/MNN10 family-domain-containing protein [Aspergillus caelatus]|uniref:Galactosyl transferase GMA12/MNN10 family-domain-containing protein n=1 Tax=Aspergillus caelatus TaxID=61420 RepID=A0A5N6ZRI1_9EURO|nr:galactosyl transferase GMA12/MNN10 family-domain-containing protein [Aspergillus caelatus]KAE8359813.1 galactosyl transferase GMA12/MNN10 family-domain-containing protein [Aspergillus caelatus]
MQFALPPRRNVNAPLYGRSSRLSLQRRKQLKAVAILGFALVAIYFLLSQLFYSSTGTPTAPAGTSSLVIVTVLDRARWSADYIQKITKNREEYAKQHGYTNFFANISDYETTLESAPRSWGVVPAVRHAMAAHPYSKHFFYLDAHALIMNPSKSLESHLLEKSRLDSLMLKDVPVVPPDSIIKTFSHLQPQDVDLILSTDGESLSSGSFVIKQGEFAQTFLDIWFDPLYRSYNFAKAETHALDHILQWHPTILARLALVSQRTINAYSKDSSGAGVDGNYKDGDLVIRFFGCDTDTKRNCEKEMEPYYRLWSKRLKND